MDEFVIGGILILIINRFRDTPSDSQPLLINVSHSELLHFPKMEIIGDSNLFSALYFLIFKDKLDFNKYEHLFPKEKRSFQEYSKHLTELKKKRAKKSIGQPFHGIGINVDVQNEIGYRPISNNKRKFFY